MYEVVHGKKFKSSYKKLRKSGRRDFDENELESVITLLGEGKSLPEKYHDHCLKGDLQNKRECHITSNILLLYEVHYLYNVITLDDIGTHAQLFGL